MFSAVCDLVPIGTVGMDLPGADGLQREALMQVFQPNFDSETIVLMGRVCDELWQEVSARTLFISLPVELEARRRMALRVMAAVAGGERDPLRLRAIGLKGIDG